MTTEMNPQTADELAKLAYETYYTSFFGEDASNRRQWEQCLPDVRAAWKATVVVVVQTALSKVTKRIREVLLESVTCMMDDFESEIKEAGPQEQEAEG